MGAEEWKTDAKGGRIMLEKCDAEQWVKGGCGGLSYEGGCRERCKVDTDRAEDEYDETKCGRGQRNEMEDDTGMPGATDRR